MTHILVTKHGIFEKAEFTDEKELEEVIFNNHKLLFSDYSIILPQREISTSGGHSTRPEAVILNFKDEVWYVVEVELANHGVWGHIVPQITRQLVALENREMRTKLIDLFLEKVKESEELKAKFIELGISELDIQRIIEKIIGKSPAIVIPIDKVPADLKVWAQAIKNEVIFLEVEKYVSNETNDVIYRIPAYMRSSPIEREDIKVKVKKIISRKEFLGKCTKPARILFTRLEEIAEKRSYIKLEPRGTSFSLTFKVGNEYRVLLTIYPDSVYIIKSNLTPEKGFNSDAIEAFVDQIKKISQLVEIWDIRPQPGFSTKPTDISIDDVNTFVNAVEELIDSLDHQDNDQNIA
ncbi:MAG: hypothetical protein GSR85_10050 [Desulfurococcales archaeon]|nr:hypothetical protein [Desulfurococcales archaeon]